MRTATQQEIHKILTTLFSVLPPKGATGTDFDTVLAGYMMALEGVTYEALRAVAFDIIQGMEGDMSVKVCPTAPEISRAVRKRMADKRKLELLSSSKPFQPVPFVSLEMRRDSARTRMEAEGRRFLCEAQSDAHAKALAKKGVQDGSIPVGSLYMAILGSFYSPKGDSK